MAVMCGGFASLHAIAAATHAKVTPNFLQEILTKH
jgi:hypothetical protein